MTLNQFIDWALSKGQVANPQANTYAGECVSLVQNFIYQVYGIPFQARGHAKDWATNGNVLQYFDKVSSPQAGDIGISGATPSNPYGHIWLYTSPNTIIEQNGRVPRKVSVGSSYLKPIAILRKKGASQGGKEVADKQTVKRLFNAMYGEEYAANMTEKEVQDWVGTPTNDMVKALIESPQRADYMRKVTDAINFQKQGSNSQFEEVKETLYRKK